MLSKSEINAFAVGDTVIIYAIPCSTVITNYSKIQHTVKIYSLYFIACLNQNFNNFSNNIKQQNYFLLPYTSINPSASNIQTKISLFFILTEVCRLIHNFIPVSNTFTVLLC